MFPYHINNGHTFVNFTMRGGNRPTNPKDILQHMGNDRENILQGMRDRCMDYDLGDTGMPTFYNHPYPKLISELVAEDNADKNEYIYNFIKEQMTYGNNVIQVLPEDQNELKAVNKELTIVSNEVDEKEAVELKNAPEITTNEMEKISKKMKSNQQEIERMDIIKLKKYWLKRKFKLSKYPNNASWYLNYSNERLINQYENLSGFYKEPEFSIEKGLEKLKEKEINREYEQAIKEVDEEKGKRNIDPEKWVFKTMSNKYNYEKQKLLCGIFSDTGFKSFHDRDTILNRTELLNNLSKIHLNYMSNPEHIVKVLNKKKEKMVSLSKLNPNEPSLKKKC